MTFFSHNFKSEQIVFMKIIIFFHFYAENLNVTQILNEFLIL